MLRPKIAVILTTLIILMLSVDPVYAYTSATNTKGELIVTLTDSSTGAGISGASISISGNESRNGTTNGSGKCTFKSLTPGMYTIMVTSIPGDYTIPASTTRNVVTQYSVESTITATQVMGTIAIKLTNLKMGDGVAGGQYTITSDNGYSNTFQTDENGDSIIGNLKSGTYTITQTRIPEGYSGEKDKSQTVEISNGSSQTVSFTVNPLASITIRYSVTDETNSLEGEKFEVSGPNDYSKTVKTDANGMIQLDNLKTGSYTIAHIVDGEEVTKQTKELSVGNRTTYDFMDKIEHYGQMGDGEEEEEEEERVDTMLIIFGMAGATVLALIPLVVIPAIRTFKRIRREEREEREEYEEECLRRRGGY